VGFVAYAVDEARKSASINGFYVVPEARRRAYGAAMVQAVYAQLDQLGVELVELNVRRDNPQALAFWEAQGFRIAYTACGSTATQRPAKRTSGHCRKTSRNPCPLGMMGSPGVPVRSCS
jgi:N-acetylglutamate synthase-like GNAT family acetyltransferase